MFCADFSADARFILSGSDDTNIRIWKARASEKLGKVAPRERQQLQYADKLVKRFSGTKEVRRIENHRHLPRVLMKMKKRRQEDKERGAAKTKRIKANSKEGSVKKSATRKEAIVNVLE